MKMSEFQKYRLGEIEPEIGDVVILDSEIENHACNPFSTCVIEDIREEKYVACYRPHAVVSDHAQAAFVRGEQFELPIETFMKKFSYFTTGSSNTKNNVLT